MGVLLDGEFELGVPILETVGRWRFAERGEEKIEGVGEPICIALTELGVRKGGRDITRLGVTGVASRGVYEEALGILDMG